MFGIATICGDNSEPWMVIYNVAGIPIFWRLRPEDCSKFSQPELKSVTVSR